MTVYQDMHGQPFFTKQQFFDGLRRFFRDQDKIYKATKNLTGDFIIMVDKSDEYETFLANGKPSIEDKPVEPSQEDPNDDLITNLQISMVNC